MSTEIGALQTYTITPVPELVFDDQRVTPAQVTVQVSSQGEQVSHLELSLVIATPKQVHVFQEFLSQFEPVEAIQALAYLPSSELSLTFVAKPELLELIKTYPVQSHHFSDSGQPSALAKLSALYQFQQYESRPMA